jgi:hypothetical protein
MIMFALIKVSTKIRYGLSFIPKIFVDLVIQEANFHILSSNSSNFDFVRTLQYIHKHL